MTSTLSRVVFSNGKDDWETPGDLFTALHREFNFDCDVAATRDNRKVDHYFGPDHEAPEWRDGLTVEWEGLRCWMNPPYSRGLQARFIEKATEEALDNDVRTVALLPARTDTRAFHEHIWDEKHHRPRPWVHEVRFIKGRVRFVGAAASAPFPSMIVVFG